MLSGGTNTQFPEAILQSQRTRRSLHMLPGKRISSVPCTTTVFLCGPWFLISSPGQQYCASNSLFSHFFCFFCFIFTYCLYLALNVDGRDSIHLLASIESLIWRFWPTQNICFYVFRYFRIFVYRDYEKTCKCSRKPRDTGS